MKHLVIAGLFLSMASSSVSSQVNAGEQKPDPNLPFNVTQVTTLSLPWKIAFLPDGRMLITEKVGGLQLVTQQGVQTPVANVPAILWQGQGGMLGVYLSPHYIQDHTVYLTYSEPGDGGSSLALARAQLKIGNDAASLEGLQVIWRDGERGVGGQFGAEVAFSPDSKYLFLTVGDRQRMTPAHYPNQPLGKLLRLTLDGKPAPGNPMAGKTGAATVPVINPPADTEAAKTAPVVRTYTFPGPNLTPAETWASGLRTPYGLAFAPDGRLWELEHGPRGGDELNLMEPGKNYGWPLVSYGINYNGVPIPTPDTRSDLTQPVIYWGPVIAPGNLMFYKGAIGPAVERVGLRQRPGFDVAHPHHRGRQGRSASRGALEHGLPSSRRGGGTRRSVMDDRGREAGSPRPPTPVGMAVSAPAIQRAAPASTSIGSATQDASSLEHVKSIIADNNCLVCHRIGREGGDIAPSLNGVGTRRTVEQIRSAIVSPPAKTSAGAPNPMPSYDKKLTEADLKNLLYYLSSLPALP